MFYFYAPWKHEETFGFLTFSGGIEMKHWVKMGQKKRKISKNVLIDISEMLNKLSLGFCDLWNLRKKIRCFFLKEKKIRKYFFNYLTSFFPTDPFMTHRKYQKTFRFSDPFRGQKKGALVVIAIICKTSHIRFKLFSLELKPRDWKN